jgi:hypothetical protein
LGFVRTHRQKISKPSELLVPPVSVPDSYGGGLDLPLRRFMERAAKNSVTVAIPRQLFCLAKIRRVRRVELHQALIAEMAPRERLKKISSPTWRAPDLAQANFATFSLTERALKA